MMTTAPVRDLCESGLVLAKMKIQVRGADQKIAVRSIVGSSLNPKIFRRQAPSMYAR